LQNKQWFHLRTHETLRHAGVALLQPAVIKQQAVEKLVKRG
jgi:hypothetical protein